MQELEQPTAVQNKKIQEEKSSTEDGNLEKPSTSREDVDADVNSQVCKLNYFTLEHSKSRLFWWGMGERKYKIDCFSVSFIF